MNAVRKLLQAATNSWVEVPPPDKDERAALTALAEAGFVEQRFTFTVWRADSAWRIVIEARDYRSGFELNAYSLDDAADRIVLCWWSMWEAEARRGGAVRVAVTRREWRRSFGGVLAKAQLESGWSLFASDRWGDSRLVSIEKALDGTLPPAVSSYPELEKALQDAIAGALDRGPRPVGEEYPNVMFRGPLLPAWLPEAWESRTYPARPEYGPFLEWLDLQFNTLLSTKELGILYAGSAVRDADRLADACGWPMPLADLGASKTLDAARRQLGILRDAVVRLMQTPAEREHSVPAQTPPGAVAWCARHSADFASVKWGKNIYTFSTSQAAVVNVLWKAWENGTPVMGEPEIQEQAGIDSTLRSLFYKHPAWGTMIRPQRKGRYGLAPPDNGD